MAQQFPTPTEPTGRPHIDRDVVRAVVSVLVLILRGFEPGHAGWMLLAALAVAALAIAGVEPGRIAVVALVLIVMGQIRFRP